MGLFLSARPANRLIFDRRRIQRRIGDKGGTLRMKGKRGMVEDRFPASLLFKRLQSVPNRGRRRHRAREGGI